MNRPFLVSIVLTFLCLQYPVFGQKGYTVTHYTDDNGMPQNSVRSLSPDAEGFLWVATENGLARFDGQRFHVFDKTFVGTSSNRFYMLLPSMAPARPGRNRGEQGERAIYAVADPEQFVKISNGVATADSAYFLNTIRKLPHFDQAPFRTFMSVGLPSHVRYLAKPEHYIIPERHGDRSFYLIDSLMVRHYHGNRPDWQASFEPTTDLRWWSYFMLGDKLYYQHENGTMLCIEKGRIRPVEMLGDLARDNGYERELKDIQVFWNITSGQVFLYRQQKLYAVEQKEGGRLTTRLLLEGFDMDREAIHSIYRDAITETIFLGSPSRGLFALTKQSFEPLTVPGHQTSNVYYAAIPRGDQHVLTPAGLIIGKDKVTGRPSYGKMPLLARLNPGDSRSLFYDSDHGLWVKIGDFLYQIDEAADSVRRKWNLYNEIKHIYPDRNGNVWIATASNGVYRMDMSAPDAQPKLVKGLIKGTYFQMWNDRMLVGTTDGLYVFDVRSGQGRLMAGTGGIYVKSIHVDKSGRIWLAANGDGILLLEKGKLKRFPLDKNHYLGSPHCIVDDDHGFFWIPTDKGLFQVSVRDLLDYKNGPSEIFYLYHAKDEGLLTNEFNGGCQPCGVKLADGTIALPSLNGLVWFRPGKVIARLPRARVVLDGIQVNRQWLPVAGDTLTLPANPVQARFFFSTPHFGNLYNLNLSYALVDDNRNAAPSDWIPVQSSDFSIAFSNLEHGIHWLLIRKIDGFGKDHFTIKKICVIVPPLWYQTWWAKVLFVVLMICIVYLYNRYRTRQILREKARLETIIAKRTESLNLALRDVEESKDEMSRQVHMLSRLLASMTHDIQSPLNYIMLTSGSISSMVEKGEFQVVSEIGEVISNSSRRMSDLLRGLLDYVKVHVYGNSIQFEQVNLSALVENKYEMFKNVSEQKGNAFRNEVPAGLTVVSDAHMLAIMIHNLLDNAVKFTQKGSIHVSADQTPGGHVMLHITNTGAGIPLHVLDTINNAEQGEAEDMTRSFRRKTGLGLLIVKEISVLINVTIHVTSTDGETRFTLQFGD